MKHFKINNPGFIKDIEGNFFADTPIDKLRKEALRHIMFWNALLCHPQLSQVARQRTAYWQHALNQTTNYKFKI